MGSSLGRVAVVVAVVAAASAAGALAGREQRTELVACRVGSFADATVAALSPDGLRVAIGWPLPNEVRLVSSTGRGRVLARIRMPTSDRFRPPRMISWSPTGDHLFIQLADRSEYSSGLAGQATQISAGRSAPTFLGWFPDGRRLLLQVPFGPIYMADLNGAALQDIVFGFGGKLSPDADELAYLGQSGALSVMQLDGGVVRQLGASAARIEAWSPDGSLLLYDDGRNFHVVRADGSENRRFAQPTFLTDAFWTDAGIYYQVSSSPGGGRSFVADPYDATPRELFPEAHAVGYGTIIQGISGDGRIVLYSVESFKSAGLRIFDRAHGIDRSLVRCSGTSRADRIAGSVLPDFIDADRGDDVIDVRGGGKDTVTCGRGRDLVRADRNDRIGRSCERTIRLGRSDSARPDAQRKALTTRGDGGYRIPISEVAGVRLLDWASADHLRALVCRL